MTAPPRPKPLRTCCRRGAERRMRIVHAEGFEVDIGAHVFPTAKYRVS